MRTTLDLDGSVVRQLKERRRREGKTMGQVASELLARALDETDDNVAAIPLGWRAQPMEARVDLEDREAVFRRLDEWR